MFDDVTHHCGSNLGLADLEALSSALVHPDVERGGRGSGNVALGLDTASLTLPPRPSEATEEEAGATPDVDDRPGRVGLAPEEDRFPERDSLYRAVQEPVVILQRRVVRRIRAGERRLVQHGMLGHRSA